MIYVLKTVNHFSKIKEKNFVKGKLFFFNYYFTTHQTLENTKNIFNKSFYGKNKKRSWE
jgi:hypothetical protein